jgi:hypothetical protein
MRLSTTVRIGCLALAAWLAGASALMGCAYAMAAEAPAATEACHQVSATKSATGQAGAHDCCDMPAGERREPNPEDGQFMECCFRVTPATMGKGKPPDVTFATSERLGPSAGPAIAPESRTAVEPFVADSSGTYLLHSVLRI